MTTPDPDDTPGKGSPFLELARRIAAAGTDQEAADIFTTATGMTFDVDADRAELDRRAALRRGDWTCEARNAAQRDAGHLCFFVEIRTCANATECHDRMVAERQRVFRVIREKAAAGGEQAEVWEHLAGEFTSPEQILNTAALPTCPTCKKPHDHVHVCAECGRAELDDGKPFSCPDHPGGVG